MDSSTDMDQRCGSEGSTSTSTSSAAIKSSNRGFQLLMKHGWKVGTGLGIYEQGRLHPLETNVKNDKRGLGAGKAKKKTPKVPNTSASDGNEKLEPKKSKALSKKARKMAELEKKLQDKEFERAFFREFWPENV